VDDLLLLAAVISAVLGSMALKRYYAMPPTKGPVAGTETWTVEEVDALRQGSVEISGPGKFRRQVSVVATARPGPDGPLTTREGKVECVFWYTETTRHYNERVDGNTVARTELAGRSWSRKPFVLEDATGKLTVWPDRAEVIGAKVVHREVERVTPEGPESMWSELTDRDATTAMVTAEYVVRAGTRVLVHGEARDLSDGELLIADSESGAPFIISTKQERALRERAAATERATGSLWLRGYGLIALAVACMVGFYML
jgi:E3 ubiquitin ligase